MEKNRKALLVYPEFPEESFWNFRYLNSKFMLKSEFGTPKGNMPPLGLLSIAPVLEKWYGRENIRIIDMNILDVTDEDLLWADEVYLSAMLTQRVGFNEVAARAKKLGKTTLGGGPFVAEDTPNLDYIFINEADLILENFLKDFFKGKAKKINRSDRKPTPEEFLRPDYSYINIHNYTTMAVQFSRGCPHDCDFCDITQRFGRQMRTKDITFVLQELNQLYDLGWRQLVFFIDDNFIGKPGEALALIKVISEWQKDKGYPFEFFTQASVLLAEPAYEELLLSLAPAGFSMVFLGIETPNEKSLIETNKAFNIRKGMSLVDRVRRIQQVGQVMILGGFIVGFDSDTADIFDQQIAFIEQIQLPTPMVTLLNPLPDTRLQERLGKEKRLHPSVVGDVAGATEVAFIPKNLTEQELIDGYKKILAKLFFPMDKYYSRCSDSLQYIANAKRIPFNLEGIYSLFSLLFEQGFKSNYKKEFWKYVIKGYIKYPKKIEYMLRWSAYGLHYNRLAKKLIS
ncbi:MAG: B12-binding domain-containing radical SAM protein [Spirochaetia bacterium]|nr:B12-binding domain-containing radical SAM protein [Spirochaetia bacterium]